MSDAHNDGPKGRATPSGASSPEGRGSGSSLTDAVVAALATVPQTSLAEMTPASDSDEADVISGIPISRESAAPEDAAADNESPSTQAERTSDPGRVSSADAPEGIVIEYHGRTDVGRVREHNEDNFLVVDLSTEQRGLPDARASIRTTLGSRGVAFAVCDGMGGAAFGEVASQMAVDTVHEVMQAGGPPRDRDQLARRLVRAVEEAGTRIFNAAKMDRNRRGMGTTATVAAMVDSTLFVGQVGDSRAYVLRGDQFALITKDQSLVNQLIEAGQLTEEEAEAFEHSNIILQALGTTEEVTVDLTFLELRRGDRLLMCSDGLSGLVHGDMIKDVLQNTRKLEDAAEQLIEMANAGGGHDNITIILADFDGPMLREPSAEARVAYQQYPLPPEDPADIGRESNPALSKATASKSGSEFTAFSDAPAGGRTGTRLWIWGITLFFIVLIGLAVWILVTDDGARVGAAETADTPGVTITSTISANSHGADSFGAVRANSPEGRIRVRTDVATGVLFVNGEPRAGNIGAGVVLELPAGAYRLELREGETRVAERVVTLSAGQEEVVDLSVPVGTVPHPALASPGQPL